MATAKPDGGWAFPGYVMEDDGESINVTKLTPGMTLRDYFASSSLIVADDYSFAALSKLIGRSPPEVESAEYLQWWADVEAALRYLKADAMLKARSK